MNLIFIRHSKSLVNPHIPITTWGLSQEGVVLAKKLQDLTQIKTLDVIYVSLQPKALETALLATKNLGIPIKTDDNLTESTSFTAKFVSVEQLDKNTKDYYSSKDKSINGGETSHVAVNRFNNVISDIVKREKDKQNIGIVSHGNILADFTMQYAKGNAYELVEKMKQPDIAVFDWNTKKFTIFFGDITL